MELNKNLLMLKRLVGVLAVVILCLLAPVFSAFALDFPRPSGYVNDFAGILANKTRQSLEQKLIELEKEKGIEMAVVTVASLKDLTIEDYAVRLFEDWQIGKKGKDNGVLLLIAPNERELRIEVGYGLEATLTDSKAGRIIRNIITLEFKNANYDAGVINGVEVIIKVVGGEAVDLGEEMSKESKSEGDFLGILFLAGGIFLSYLGSFLARSKQIWPGGLMGAVLGGVLGWFIFLSKLPALMAALSLGLLGLLFDYFLSKNYRHRKSQGLPTSWWRSGGGFFGGGSRRQFGGFGGGTSGGGGGSGRW